jgi:ArsR family transcriptional regulator
MSLEAEKPVPADRLFRAFADRTRLRILHLLRDGELCVCDLVAVLRAPQPTVSRHLAYLRKAGLVAARRDGMWMHYQLAPPAHALHAKLLECLKTSCVSMPDAERDMKRLKRATTNRIRCCP